MIHLGHLVTFACRPLDPGCSCMTCKTYSRAFLHNLVAKGLPFASHLVTYHNVAYTQVNNLASYCLACLACRGLTALVCLALQTGLVSLPGQDDSHSAVCCTHGLVSQTLVSCLTLQASKLASRTCSCACPGVVLNQKADCRTP